MDAKEAVLAALDKGPKHVSAVLLALAVVNGVQVEGGAAGVGKVTTRSVVQGIACIIIFDMIIGLLATPG